jgi:uncharacterized membrane-anchored protein
MFNQLQLIFIVALFFGGFLTLSTIYSYYKYCDLRLNEEHVIAKVFWLFLANLLSSLLVFIIVYFVRNTWGTNKLLLSLPGILQLFIGIIGILREQYERVVEHYIYERSYSLSSSVIGIIGIAYILAVIFVL